MIIAISGKKGSGKTTLANLIKTQLPYFEIKSFATPVYSIVSILTGKPIKYLKENKQEILMGYTVREWLQKIGTDWIRKQIDEDIWVNILMRDYTPQSNWIVDDMRFDNEADAISDCNSLFIKLVGRGQEEKHESEHGLDDWSRWDIIFDNSGDDIINSLQTHLNAYR